LVGVVTTVDAAVAGIAQAIKHLWAGVPAEKDGVSHVIQQGAP